MNRGKNAKEKRKKKLLAHTNGMCDMDSLNAAATACQWYKAAAQGVDIDASEQ